MRRIPITNSKSKEGSKEDPNAAAAPEEAASATGATDAASNDPAPPSGLEESGAVEELRRQLEEREAENQALQGEMNDTREQLLRALADIDNVRKRGRQEREEAAQFGAQTLLSDLLTVIDNLERAVAAGETATRESLLEGVNLTLRQFHDTLRRHGVEPIEGEGQPFNAQLHEAIMRAEPTEEHPAGTVVDEIRKGYTLRGRLLRPSLVKVAQEE
ncbi:MAG: nucleotide exchange factor GrpE [Armatimonadetes bacterium]|nr:nucleotide exchange factor GrpE [Armatimonadota bacterium]